MRIVTMGACVAVLGLAGCEEFNFTEPTDNESIYLDLQDETVAIRSELDTLDVTPDASIPLTGSATYEGTALIALDTPTRDSELIGHATVTADFATEIVSGQMSGFYGAIDDGGVEALDGDITIAKGLIDLAQDDQITTKIDGTLVGATDVLDVNATLTGNFMGDPAFGEELPPAIALEATPESVFTLNGDAVDGGMEVIGLAP